MGGPSKSTPAGPSPLSSPSQLRCVPHRVHRVTTNGAERPGVASAFSRVVPPWIESLRIAEGSSPARSHSPRSLADGVVDPLARGRERLQEVRRSTGPRRQHTLTAGADAVERTGARAAPCALEAADPCVGTVRRQVTVAVLTSRSKFEHALTVPRNSSRGYPTSGQVPAIRRAACRPPARHLRQHRRGRRFESRLVHSAPVRERVPIAYLQVAASERCSMGCPIGCLGRSRGPVHGCRFRPRTVCSEDR